MKRMRKTEMQANLEHTVKETLNLLEELHIIHNGTELEKLLDLEVPGTEITVAKLITNLFNIIKPLLKIVRRQFPAFFAVLDWSEDIAMKLFSSS